MAEIGREKILKKGKEVLTITEYIKRYGEGVTIQAIGYAMENNKLDYVRFGKDRMVVLTEKSRSYSPNKNIKRKPVKKTAAKK